MLFNSRSVAFLLASLVSIVSTVAISFYEPQNIGLIFIVFVVTFLATFAAFFMTMELLVLRELRKIYRIFDRIRGRKIEFHRNNNINVRKISQELFDFANTKEREIEELKKIESFRREFLADISHELKTPVFAAQGFIHTLMDGAIDDLKVRDKFLKKAAKSLGGLENLVQDLITITQMETGEIRMNLEDFDINQLTHEIMEQLEGKAKKRKMSLKFAKNSDKPYYVYADYYRINQVLTNLIDNAIKYGNEGGEVVVSFEKEKDGCDVSVMDNGQGIPFEHQDRIFQRFYRVDKSRSREKGGTGLGLSIVKHIVEAHGSKIFMSSEEGETIFTFKLKRGKVEEA